MHKIFGLGFLLAAASAGATAQECESIFLHFTSREEVSKSHVVISVDEQFLLNQNGLFQYSKSQQVKGSSADSAIDSYLDYSRFSLGQPGPSVEDMLNLVQRLKVLGVFDLKDDTSGASSSVHHANLNLRAHCKETQLSFSSIDAPKERSQVIAKIRDFFNQQLPRYQVRKRERLSQGDNGQPVSVSIGELLAAPERYDGKRVRTRGVYNMGYEHSTLSEHGQSLWLGEWSTVARDTAPLSLLSGSDLIIDGIFFAGPSGHLGGYSGAIVRLTRAIAQ